ncbi:hypothetical protein [Tsukamurella paurometabola]|uniref:Lipoprotein n=1 Tax=Tsukamurella paurometabola TaxID=2061 RepID=A0ABS5NEM5_TSUPA|nr:hypothetical protein [Tsukamurella paurometabola]MBS4102761.1 hypothetical protein [Tsukamurella paurometabola]
MKLLTRLACAAAMFATVAVTSCSMPPERPTAAEGPTPTSTRTIYCPAPGEGNPSDLCEAHAAGVGLNTPRETIHVVTCPPSGSSGAPAGCLAHESGVPAPSSVGSYGTPVPAEPR